MKFLERMLTVFFDRQKPDSTSAKPRFMKNTSEAVSTTQMVSSATVSSSGVFAAWAFVATPRPSRSKAAVLTYFSRALIHGLSSERESVEAAARHCGPVRAIRKVGRDLRTKNEGLSGGSKKDGNRNAAGKGRRRGSENANGTERQASAAVYFAAAISIEAIEVEKCWRLSAFFGGIAYRTRSMRESRPGAARRDGRSGRTAVWMLAKTSRNAVVRISRPARDRAGIGWSQREQIRDQRAGSYGQSLYAPSEHAFRATPQETRRGSKF